MPTKRTRISRRRTEGAVTPSELEWLTGEPQPGANRFWRLNRSPERLARRRALLETHAHLIPPGRLAALENDVAHWVR